MEIDVYVPTSSSELRERVWAGSGIVGSEVSDTGRLRLDYEGDTEMYPSYAERVRRAAERHCWEGPEERGYPTSACAYVDPEQVLLVGRYVEEDERVVVTDEEALTAWLGVEELEEDELAVG